MAVKLQSSTRNTTAEVSRDSAGKPVAIVFSGSQKVQVYWPVKDWPNLKQFLDNEINDLSKEKNEKE